jgi:chemotaxis protein CheX
MNSRVFLMNATYVSEIEQIVQMIFETMLSMTVQRVDDEPAEQHRLLGTIQVTGDNALSLVLSVSEGVARTGTANMLAMTPAEVTDEDQRDVVAELTNMIGGNFKSVIPGSNFLSLPTVVEGRDLGLQVPGAELIDDVVLVCESGSLRVRLFAQTSAK